MICLYSITVMLKSLTFFLVFFSSTPCCLMLKDRQTWHHSFKESWSCHNSFDSPSRAWRFKNSLSLFVLSPTAFLELSVRCYLSVFVFFSSLSVHLFLCAQQIPHSAIVLSFFSSLEEEVENFDVSSLQEEALRNIEADSFWCMSKLLDGIQVSVCLRLCLKEELLYTRCHFEVKCLNLLILFHWLSCRTSGLFGWRSISLIGVSRKNTGLWNFVRIMNITFLFSKRQSGMELYDSLNIQRWTTIRCP